MGRSIQVLFPENDMEIGKVFLIGTYRKRIIECETIGDSYWFFRCIASQYSSSSYGIGKSESWRKSPRSKLLSEILLPNYSEVSKNDLVLYTHFKYKSRRFFELLK
jgi:hypothetical protein